MTFYRWAGENDAELVPYSPILGKRTTICHAGPPYAMLGHSADLAMLSCRKKTFGIRKGGEAQFLWLTHLSGSTDDTDLNPSAHKWAGSEKESALTREPHLWEQSGQGMQFAVRPSSYLQMQKHQETCTIGSVVSFYHIRLEEDGTNVSHVGGWATSALILDSRVLQRCKERMCQLDHTQNSPADQVPSFSQRKVQWEKSRPTTGDPREHGVVKYVAF